MNLSPSCLICNQCESALHNVFKTKSQHSHTPLVTFIERFTKINLKKFGNSNICTDCVEKLNNYDLSEVACNRIQEYILQLFNESLKHNQHNRVDVWDSFDIHLNDFDCQRYKKTYGQNSSTDNMDHINIQEGAVDVVIIEPEICSERFQTEGEGMFHGDGLAHRGHVEIKEEYDIEDTTQEALERLRDAANRFKCPKCPRTYKHRKHLKSHLQYECSKGPQFHCEFCPKKFYRKSYLKTHNISHSSVEPLKIKCPTCTNTYKLLTSLQRHLKYGCGKEPQFHWPTKAPRRSHSKKQMVFS